jgi:hypothetical protein
MWIVLIETARDDRFGSCPTDDRVELGMRRLVGRKKRQTQVLSVPSNGQDLAPWFKDQVAVASSGLFPQPLSINAAASADPGTIAQAEGEVNIHIC